MGFKGNFQLSSSAEKGTKGVKGVQLQTVAAARAGNRFGFEDDFTRIGVVTMVTRRGPEGKNGVRWADTMETQTVARGTYQIGSQLVSLVKRASGALRQGEMQSWASISQPRCRRLESEERRT